MIRIVLSEEDFRRLVAGLIAVPRASDGQVVEIILADIGWDRMTRAIAVAMGKQDRDG